MRKTLLFMILGLLTVGGLGAGVTFAQAGNNSAGRIQTVQTMDATADTSEAVEAESSEGAEDDGIDCQQEGEHEGENEGC